MLEAKFTVERGDFVVDVELACPAGITCVMGPSGSGKSTILGVLAGLVEPTRGRVVMGADVWLDRARGIAVPVHERRLAYVFQGLALFPHMSALNNVAFAMHEVPRADRAAKAHALLERVGVAHLAKRRPRTFSGGEAQRVALARALARAPRLLLFDEPFSALDRELRGQVVALVKELVKELGVPMVHVTHSIAEAKMLGDHLVRIDKGKVVAAGKADDVLAGVTTLEE